MEVGNLNQGIDNVNPSKLLLSQTREETQARHADGWKSPLQKRLEACKLLSENTWKSQELFLRNLPLDGDPSHRRKPQDSEKEQAEKDGEEPRKGLQGEAEDKSHEEAQPALEESG